MPDTEYNDNAVEKEQVVEGLSFSTTLNCLNDGLKMSRKAWWSDKDMFIFLVLGSTFNVNRPPLLGIYEEGTPIRYHPHIDMKHRDGYVVPWTPSQADMLERDWYINK